MIDWNRKYGEVGYNIYGIKWTQDGKYFRLSGREVDQYGQRIQEPSELPESEIDKVREALTEKGISWHPNAKLETLKKRLAE